MEKRKSSVLSTQSWMWPRMDPLWLEYWINLKFNIPLMVYKLCINIQWKMITDTFLGCGNICLYDVKKCCINLWIVITDVFLASYPWFLIFVVNLMWILNVFVLKNHKYVQGKEQIQFIGSELLKCDIRYYWKNILKNSVHNPREQTAYDKKKLRNVKNSHRFEVDVVDNNPCIIEWVNLVHICRDVM